MQGGRNILTGGPGTGKTIVLQELACRGYRVVADPFREVIRERVAAGLSPRPPQVEFAKLVLAKATARYDEPADGPAFFEYGLLEPLQMLQEAGAINRAAILEELGVRPVCPIVFLFPAWEAIYTQDEERDHTFEHCQAVTEALAAAYRGFGFQVIEVPMATPSRRADLILEVLGLPANWPVRGG